MTKYLVFLVATMLFFAACTSDNSASDNENGPDELTPVDHTAVVDDTVTVDDAVIDNDQSDQSDQSDQTDQFDDIQTDDIVTDDITTDETAEEGGDDGDTVVETPDDDFDPEAAIACCVEIVKEWWRCPAEIADPYTPGYTTEKADECIACVSGLAVCTDFLPLDAQWACADACNDLCPPGTVRENDDTVGKGLGQSRRAVAAEYCGWMVDTACSYQPSDFTGLGSTEPLNACF